MTTIRKTITASLAALVLGSAALATTVTPAAAWHNGYGWGGPGIAAGVLGGLAVGAIAAGAAGAYDGGYGYGYGCVSRAPTYDAYGNFAGYRRVRVAC